MKPNWKAKARNDMKAKFILLEPCNFVDYPVGGTLTFAKQLMNVYGNDIALVGYGEKGEPIGRWFTKEFNNQYYDYFAISKYSPEIIKPLIPARLTAYVNVKRHRNAILSLGADSFFVQSHELLNVVTQWNLKSVCYCFPGAGVPLQTSRYPWARILAAIFDTWFLKNALKADVLVAAADADSIQSLKNRRRGILQNKDIVFLSTRVDTRIFRKENRANVRNELGFNRDQLILVTTGRIHYTKGWRFLLQVVYEYKKINANCLFIYVGDGAERKKMENEVARLDLQSNVIITGFLLPDCVAKYIQAADVFLLGSQKEGWSTSLIEALACYKPIVTTRVSSAVSIVKDDVNGFVVEQNDLNGFVSSITKALHLSHYDEYIDNEIAKYSLDKLKQSLGEVWDLAK